MFAIDFYQEAMKLEGKTENTVRNRLFEADTFGVTLLVYNKDADSRLHDCAKDEFFYVLKGEMEMQVESKTTHLKEGEGILVKAGEKHKHRPVGQAWILTITKHPHKHKFYEETHNS